MTRKNTLKFNEKTDTNPQKPELLINYMCTRSTHFDSEK